MGKTTVSGVFLLGLFFFPHRLKWRVFLLFLFLLQVVFIVLQEQTRKKHSHRLSRAYVFSNVVLFLSVLFFFFFVKSSSRFGSSALASPFFLYFSTSPTGARRRRFFQNTSAKVVTIVQLFARGVPGNNNTSLSSPVRTEELAGVHVIPRVVPPRRASNQHQSI